MDSWFFENSGFAKITELNGAYTNKATAFVNDTLSKNYTGYSPWMSNVENLATLELLFTDKKLIPSDRESLNILERMYLGDGIESRLCLGGISDAEMSTLKNAISLVKDCSSDISRLFSEVVRHIVPINTDAGHFQKIGNGFSSHLAKGAVFLSVPKMENNNELQLAINIAHEVGHQCLYIYQTADPIISEGLHKPVYSSVRKAERPAIQSFHATVALAFMIKFLNELNDVKDTKTKYFADTKEKLTSDFLASFDSFSEIQFTEIGQLLFNDLRSYARTI